MSTCVERDYRLRDPDFSFADDLFSKFVSSVREKIGIKVDPHILIDDIIT